MCHPGDGIGNCGEGLDGLRDGSTGPTPHPVAPGGDEAMGVDSPEAMDERL